MPTKSTYVFRQIIQTGFIMFIFIVVGLIAPRPVAAQQFVITDLGKLGGRASQSSGITEDGRVAGWSETSQLGTHGSAIKKPFLWQRGIMSELPSLASGKGASAVAIAPSITSSGFFRTNYITGDAETSTGSTHAFLYTNGFWGGIQDLGTLPNTTESHGHSVNGSGQVVGWAASASGSAIAFFYTGSHGMIDISFGSPSAAYGINDAGQVVGYMYTGSAYHAFLYNSVTGQRKDLGSASGFPNSYALAINRSGQVVGYVTPRFFRVGDYILRPFVYTNSSGFTILPGNINGSANAINSSGQVVGTFQVAGTFRPVYHAFLYQNGQVRDLNNLIPANSGWIVTAASSINDAGQIVGYGTIGGEQHAFLMTPIPSTYTVTEVPLTTDSVIPGNSLRINNSGQVVGESATGHAAVWDSVSGHVTELTTAPSHAYNINDFGEIVGESAGLAFYWDGHNMVNLGALGGAGSRAFGINIGIPSHIVGTSPAAVNDHAFYTSRNHFMMDLGVLFGFRQSAATGINDFDQVVGASFGDVNDPSSTRSMAFYWTASGGLVPLPTLSGNLDQVSEAWDINNTGQIVGMSQVFFRNGQQPEHACLWAKDSQGQWQITDLGSPRGFRAGQSKASAINNLGQVVGYSNIKDNATLLPQNHAFLWVNGTMIDLNDKIAQNPQNPNQVPILTTALDINDTGQIVCLGFLNGEFRPRVYLLTR